MTDRPEHSAGVVSGSVDTSENGASPVFSIDPSENRRILAAIITGLKEAQQQPHLFSSERFRNDAPVSAEIMSIALGCTDRQVRQYAQESIIVKEQRGRYPFIDSVRRLIADQRYKLSRGGVSDTLEDLRKAGQRIDNERSALELQRLKGELVPASEVERTAFELARATSEAFMNLPARLADELAAEKDAFTVRTRLEDEIRGILENLTKERTAA